MPPRKTLDTLRRDKIRKFVGDDKEAIIFFENLFEEVSQIFGINLLAGNNEAKINNFIEQYYAGLTIEDVEVLVGNNKAQIAALQGRTKVLEEAQGFATFHCDTTQTAGAPNTEDGVDMDEVINAEHWSIGTPASRMVCERNGKYIIVYSGEILKSSGSGAANVFMWLKKNGSNVDDSTVTSSVRTNGDRNSFTGNIILDLEKDDYLEIFWETTNTNAELEAFAAASNYPSTPAVAVSMAEVDVNV